MPNHVTNKLTINGTNERINEVKEFIKCDEFGVGTIDFNKITPMPKWVFRGNLGKQDELKYGVENCWYRWCINNWGTKWNAYDIPNENSYDNIICFNTAWSSPVDLIQKLSWIYPDVEFEICYADEDIGNNLGRIVYKDGEVIDQTIYEERTDEAIKFACEIKDYDYNEYIKDF